jgi:hypothetical protein
MCWIGFAQIPLKIGKPSSELSPQPSFGKEPETGRGMVASPIRIHELTDVPASTERDAAGHDCPPHYCQGIPQRVSQLSPSEPGQFPVSHFTHVKP